MNKLDSLKKKVFGKEKSSSVTTFFYLIKDLGLSDHLLGKEFEGEFVWKGEKVPFSFKQKPICVSTLNVLIREFEKHIEKENKSNKRKR